MINSSVYNQVAKTYVAGRMLEAERARIAREAQDILGARRLKRLPVAPRGAIFARRFRALARLRTA